MKSSFWIDDDLVLRAIAVVLLCVLAPTLCFADGFAATIQPPRFELTAKPGDVIRQTLKIGHSGSDVGRYVIRTADWDLNEQGGVVIHPPELQPGSCRPWARIERRNLTLNPGREKKYRFELHVPEGAPRGECRVAILVGGDPEDSAVAQAGNLQFPVQGQIAVIIYVAVGGAQPVLSIESIRFGEVNGRSIPVAIISNAGDAHGRPDGLLLGKSGAESVDLVVSTIPVLAGTSREVPLWPVRADGAEYQGKLDAPLHVTGEIEWSTGRQPVDVMLN